LFVMESLVALTAAAVTFIVGLAVSAVGGLGPTETESKVVLGNSSLRGRHG